MSKKQNFGLFVLAGALAAGVYIWYKGKKPTFQILEFDNRDQSVKWQYGKIINVVKAGQEDTYRSSPDSDFFVNVAPIEEKDQIIGIRFNFLGKDTREPRFVYFQ